MSSAELMFLYSYNLVEFIPMQLFLIAQKEQSIFSRRLPVTPLANLFLYTYVFIKFCVLSFLKAYLRCRRLFVVSLMLF